MYSVDFQKLELVERIGLDNTDISELLYENEGSFTKEDQTMIFRENGIEVDVTYNIHVSGNITSESGDYWTPSYTEVDIDDIEVDIVSVNIEGEEYLATNDILEMLYNRIESELK